MVEEARARVAGEVGGVWNPACVYALVHASTHTSVDCLESLIDLCMMAIPAAVAAAARRGLAGRGSLVSALAAYAAPSCALALPSVPSVPSCYMQAMQPQAASMHAMQGPTVRRASSTMGHAAASTSSSTGQGEQPGPSTRLINHLKSKILVNGSISRHMLILHALLPDASMHAPCVLLQMRGGPLSLAEFMQDALTSPQGGYYMQRDVFGAEGDFITSPEISQMFGEVGWRSEVQTVFAAQDCACLPLPLAPVTCDPSPPCIGWVQMVGIWALHTWMQMGQPQHVNLVELGPGRGTLMADLLRGISGRQGMGGDSPGEEGQLHARRGGCARNVLNL